MAEQEYETVRAEVADRILTVTLNRPEKLNAFNPQMMQLTCSTSWTRPTPTTRYG